MEFANDKQTGRTRVNFVSDSKKTRKTHIQHKDKKLTAIDKVCILQNDLFKEGMKYSEYENHIQDKINKDYFYYKNLSSDDIDFLKKRYKNKETKKQSNLNITLSERNRKNRQAKLFKDKKNNLIYDQMRGLIDALFNELKKSNAIGVGRINEFHSNDPEKWNETKKLLFLGGRYLEGQDKGWVDIYQKLVSNNSANLFDLHSSSALNDHVYNR
jgi:hypothetical protein